MATKKLEITVNGIEVPPKKIGIEEAKKIIGWREAKKGEKGYPYLGPEGKGRFVLTNNKTNRPFKMSLAKFYQGQFLRGEWAGQWNSPSETHNGESMVLDSDGGIVSCAHRCAGLILAEYERQRLVEFSDGPNSPAAKKLEEYGCKEPITFDVLLVEGVDPKAADTADIGRTRSLGDVVYRRHEFSNNSVTPTEEVRYTQPYAGALRLVWLRLQGMQVSPGPKGAIPHVLEFKIRHPLLNKAAVRIKELNEATGKTGKRISPFISPAYATGLLYLAAFTEEDRAAYEDGSLDMGVEPALWAKAEEFWKLFAEDIHSEPNAIKSLHKLLTKNKQRRARKYSRDVLCTLVARAFLSWTGKVDDWSTVDTLSRGLATKNSEVLRFGGLDLDRATLKEKGFLQPDKPITRRRSGNWRVGDKTFVVGSEWNPWSGTITSFTDDGKKARVMDANEEYADCDIDWLTKDESQEDAA